MQKRSRGDDESERGSAREGDDIREETGTQGAEASRAGRSGSTREIPRSGGRRGERGDPGVQPSMPRSMMPYQSENLVNWPFAFRDFGGFPFEMMRRFHREFDRMIEGTGGRAGTTFLPRAEAFERDDRLVIRIELPGMEKDDVHVRIEGDHLIVEGERRMEDVSSEGYEGEFVYGRFRRMIALPGPVEAGDVQARFRNGVLEITIPHGKGPAETREIPIQT